MTQRWHSKGCVCLCLSGLLSPTANVHMSHSHGARVCVLFPVGWNFLRQGRSCLKAESWYILRGQRNQQAESINWCSGTCEAVVCVAGNVLRALSKISQSFTKQEPHSTLPICQTFQKNTEYPRCYLDRWYLTRMSVGPLSCHVFVHIDCTSSVQLITRT